MATLYNVLPFLCSRGSMLLSFIAWIQLSVLSGYPESAISRTLYGEYSAAPMGHFPLSILLLVPPPLTTM